MLVFHHSPQIHPKPQATQCGKLVSLPSHLSFSFPLSCSVIISPWVMLSGWLSYIARGDVQCKTIISGISMHAEFRQPTQRMKVLGCMTQLWVGKTAGERRERLQRMREGPSEWDSHMAKQLIKNVLNYPYLVRLVWFAGFRGVLVTWPAFQPAKPTKNHFRPVYNFFQ